MFHHTNQSTSSRQLTSNDRQMNELHYHPYDGHGAPARVSVSSVGVPAGGGHHARSVSDMTDLNHGDSFNYSSHSSNFNTSDHQWEMEDEDDDDEPMDILYEREVARHSTAGAVNSTHGHGHHERHHSEPINMSSISNLDLQLGMSADHLMALLQREANDYSVPLPVRYYPTEFIDDIEGDNKGSEKATKKTSIGPWRKRIASWMYDVVDHFQYDRNVVSIALRYIDQYVGHLLVEADRRHRRGDSGIGSSRGHSSSSSSSSSQPIKRRHFQLIAVTSLYLAIKVHGELMENDPISGAEYDVIESLIHEVDGRAFLQRSKDGEDIEEEEELSSALSGSSQESDDDLRHVSSKLSELKRRQRKGRWSTKLSQFGLPLANHSKDFGRSASLPLPRSKSVHRVQPKAPHSGLPYKPRKRGILGGPLRLHSFVELSRGLFTARDITDTEKKILVSLNYVVNPPTSRRFVGELLRLLALTYCSAVDGGNGSCIDTEVTAKAAERMLSLDRKEILAAVLENARGQIEGAASVPELSIGCLPSVVAYGAMVNAVEDEFDRLASSSSSSSGDDSKDEVMEMENASPQLEDFQRHYRRYSRNTSPSPASNNSTSNLQSDRELFLEAWKEKFLVAVFHATNCFLSPDSQDIFKVRELLLDQEAVNNGQDASSPGASSPHEKGKRSPRSPRSVVIGANSPNRRHVRNNSFFSQCSSGTAGRLMSPYDSQGRRTSEASFRSIASAVSTAGVATASHPRRSYYKQVSEPISEFAPPAMPSSKRFARAQTPDVSRLEMARQRVLEGSGYGDVGGSYRTHNSSAGDFHPPCPNPFFSA